MHGPLPDSKDALPPMCFGLFMFCLGILEMRFSCAAQASLLDLPPGPPNHADSSFIRSSLDYFSTYCDVNG